MDAESTGLLSFRLALRRLGCASQSDSNCINKIQELFFTVMSLIANHPYRHIVAREAGTFLLQVNLQPGSSSALWGYSFFM